MVHPCLDHDPVVVAGSERELDSHVDLSRRTGTKALAVEPLAPYLPLCFQAGDPVDEDVEVLARG
jgi:hypothetical protein